MSSNIMKEYISFSRKCINKYVKHIMGDLFEQDIFDELINPYMDIRYYNLYDNKYKLMSNNIGYYLLKETLELLKNAKTEKERFVIKNTFSIFQYVLYFDNVIDCESAKVLVKEISEFRVTKLEIKDLGFERSFFEELKQDLKKKKEFLDHLETKDFTVIYNKTNINGVYDTSLEHNLKFPKIYSKYSIDKAFVSKDISEHSLLVLYPSIVAKILNDIIKSEFDKKYLVNYSISLHEKPRKIKRVYNLIDEDMLKDKVIIKINYKDYVKNKEVFIKYMSEGFNYAVLLDNTFVLNSNNLALLKIFKYIIVKQNSNYYKEFSNLNNVIVVR